VAPVPEAAAKPAPKAKAAAKPARAARMQARHWLVIFSFILCVLAPIGVAGFYLYTVAADQYTSKVGFSVRKEEAGSSLDSIFALPGLSNSSSNDTDILYEYIQSQKLVRGIDADINLRAIYGKPDQDFWFRLPEGAPIEDLVAYWLRMVRIFYDPGTGLIEIEVRAFDPADAQMIAQEIFDRSTERINALSSVARADTTRYAKEELEQAVARLKLARTALTKFRNDTQIVDPTADIQGRMGLVNSLQAQLAEALIELDLLSETTNQGDPRVTQATRKIDVIRARIEDERSKLGVSGEGDQGAFANLVGEFEILQVDREFAEKSYLSALAAHDAAVAEAGRQSRYLAAYVEPTLAETAIHPRRIIILSVLSVLLLGSWGTLVLIYYSLKDRR
jgi:capsular polysaccharide transport system permease protein